MSIKRPFIWAHRGASGYAAGNSMISFKTAKELGADGIETDVFRTKDHHVVVSHDGSVVFEGQKISITATTLEDLHKIPLDQKLLTFSELLDFTQPLKMPISVDVRDLGTSQDLLSVLKTREAFQSVEICIDSIRVLTKIRGLCSDAILIFSPGIGWASSRAVEQLKQYLPTFDDLHLKAINFSWKFYVDHPELIYLIHKEGKMLAYAWDVHLMNVMQKVYPLNLDALYTNFPDRLKAFYEAPNP